MKITAAGIIIFRNENNHPLILGLKALPKFRRKGKGIWDVPKGGLDFGERTLQAAYRECLEETGIVPIRIIDGPYIDGSMAIWLGETDEEEVVIGKNPESGQVEHEGYRWLKPADIKKDCLNYLKPSLTWAEKRVWEYLRIC